MINGNLIDSTITIQMTQRLKVPPPRAADMGGRGCANAHVTATESIGIANIYVPLKSTGKYDFGLHLSKTTSFLEIQMVQQIAEAVVSSNRSSIEDGCDIPNTT